jgi:RNA polymerase sigma-70 factor, ECF subfamily
MHHQSDSDLVGLLRRGIMPDVAFAELYARHNRRVLTYCVRVLGNEDEGRDVFQETFIRFFHAVQDRTKSASSVENVPAYILRIARNLCLNHKRDRKRTVTLEDFEQQNTAHASVAHNYEREQLLHLITLALESVDFDHREAFVLRQYEGYSYQEIAELTGVSVSTVTNRIWRAKERVKHILAPYINEIECL